VMKCLGAHDASEGEEGNNCQSKNIFTEKVHASKGSLVRYYWKGPRGMSMRCGNRTRRRQQNVLL
jgi:hypothetical protein